MNKFINYYFKEKWYLGIIIIILWIVLIGMIYNIAFAGDSKYDYDAFDSETVTEEPKSKPKPKKEFNGKIKFANPELAKRAEENAKKSKKQSKKEKKYIESQQKKTYVVVIYMYHNNSKRLIARSVKFENGFLVGQEIIECIYRDCNKHRFIAVPIDKIICIKGKDEYNFPLEK